MAEQDAGAGRNERAEPLVEYRSPDFICVGAQKAGTTWLDKNLRCHPKLWLPPVKELHYFDDLYLPNCRRWTGDHRRRRGAAVLEAYIAKVPPDDWDYRLMARLADFAGGPISDDWYTRIFSLAGADQVCGEVTPDYATLPEEGMRHILRLAPKAKIILSLRDPIERSWSHIRMLARNRKSVDLAQMKRFAGNKDMLERGDYPSLIANWSRFFADDRLLVIFLDEIADTPSALLERVCDFLGVDFAAGHFGKAAERVHVGPPEDIPPQIYEILKERFRPVYEGIARLYPKAGKAWLARHY